MTLHEKTRLIINKYGVNAKKSLGQNFLVDENIMSKIISGADISPEDFVIEIGPGIGSLTGYLCKKAGQVICVEIDKNFIPILNDTLSEYNNLTVIHADFLSIDMEYLLSLKKTSGKTLIVSNLPYYITTQIFMHIYNNIGKRVDNAKEPNKELPGKLPERLICLLQKEAASRLTASPSTKQYGPLAIYTELYYDFSVITNVSPNCFLPKPTVESTVIRLDIKNDNKPNGISDISLFNHVISAAFSQRRKTIANCISNYADINIGKESASRMLLELFGNPDIRGEALSANDYISLTNLMSKGV